MAEKEVKDIDSLIDQGLNAENNELDLREKELDDEAAKQALAPLVKKIELALVTIAQFQQSLAKK